MVKKKNKKEKGRGAEKTAQKLAKKSQKEGGMEDIEALIAEFKLIDKKKTEVREEKCTLPTPRINLSVVVHPEKDEILLFGGEYDTGNKTYMYNDLFIYHIKKNEWSQLFVPNPPPPRCSHQAVALPKDGGQMWVFGGEFASPTGSKFYHYKDLWVLHLQHKKWEQISAPGGPSPRSGHRMTSYKKQLIVFGGFHESSRDFMYFNDCYCFDLLEYQWNKINPSGRGPNPRSGCHLMPTQNGVLIIGGYSKVKVKKDIDKGTPHDDIYLLEPEASTSGREDTAITKWKWAKVKESGAKPSPRSAFGMTPIGGNRALIFGGVFDEDEEEDINSVFYNSMHCLDLTSYRWFPFDLRKQKQKTRAKKLKETAENPKGGDDVSDEETDNKVESEEKSDLDQRLEKKPVWIPCGRMNSILVAKHGILYLYGGAFEEDEKQVTLNDLWSLNLKSPTTWNQLFEADDTSGDWHESDSPDDEEEEESGKADEASGGKDDHREQDDLAPKDREGGSVSEGKCKPKHPKVGQEENLDEYWLRTSEHWLEVMCNEADEDVRADDIKKAAKEMAETWFVRKNRKRTKESER